METYRITILNDISQKRRRINIEAISFEEAIRHASWKIHHTSERIICGKLWHKDK